MKFCIKKIAILFATVLMFSCMRKQATYQEKIPIGENKFKIIPKWQFNQTIIAKIGRPALFGTFGYGLGYYYAAANPSFFTKNQSAVTPPSTRQSIGALGVLGGFVFNWSVWPVKKGRTFDVSNTEQFSWLKAFNKNESVKYAITGTQGEYLIIESGKVKYELQPVNYKPAKPETKIAQNFYKRKYALLIGNNSYRTLPKLTTSINDITDVSQRLKEMGFTIAQLTDIADKSDFEKAIRNFSQQLKETESEVALFYYVGHGKEYEGKNYLLPTQVDLQKDDITLAGLDLESIMGVMNRSNTKINLMYLDIDQNKPIKNGFGNGWGPYRGFKTFSRIPPALRIYYSTISEGIVDASKSRNGYFTQALLRYIQPGIDSEKLIRLMNKTVYEETQHKQILYSTGTMFDFTY